MEAHLIRGLWTLFEPIHAVTYFSPHARDQFASIGFTRYWDGYFAGRAAPLGAVTAAPVSAIFSSFAPRMAERALPAVWSVARPEETLVARATGAGLALRELVPDADLVARAAALLLPVAQSVETAGRPLGAANSVLAPSSDPYHDLWQSTATLREHRGDGHVAALVSGGIEGISALILRCALDLDAASVKKARGWSDDEWSRASNALVTRGLLRDDFSLAPSGADALNHAEAATDRLASQPWATLSPTDVRSVARALAPIASACAPLYPTPNPIGMPRPWDPTEAPVDDPLARVGSTIAFSDSSPTGA